MKYYLSKKFILISSMFSLMFCASSWSMASAENHVSSDEYQQRPTLATSLFQSDKTILSEDAIQQVLSSKFVLPENIKIAVFRFSENDQNAIKYYGNGYWRSEEYLKMQQNFLDVLEVELAKSQRVQEVALLPALLTPKEPTIPIIRETAVRLQSDMLMVFRISSNVYEKYRFLQSTQAKAYSTCEIFLLDVRTGLIPFSKIVTTEFLATKESSDANFTETMARSEKEASLLSLKQIGMDTVAFLNLLPVDNIN